ncbi:MAG TPA: DinB family protein [Bryobacteraceae bacterium]|jgi:uncharacterized damage-inducible protein DinB
MLSRKLRFAIACIPVLLMAALPASAETDLRAVVVKHLQTSRDFTLKVADQMPEAAYSFKLTPPQMSFAEQMVHLSQSLAVFWSPFFSGNPEFAKPASLSKPDVIAFVKKSFDTAIERVSRLTPEQMTKSYQSNEGTMTGLELLMGMLDHTTHHRASAEMYLRAKGITPTEYEF